MDTPRTPTLVAVPATSPAQSEHGARLREMLRSYRVGAGARVLREFADFAGSRENVASLVAGLAWGARITLRSEGEDVTEQRAIEFVSPAPPLRNYDIYVCLSLARRQLAGFGIARPEPQELREVLMLVLGLRAQGMTWSSMSEALLRASGAPRLPAPRPRYL